MTERRVETSKKFKHYGEKVKQVAFHPSQTLIVTAQYNGEVLVFNYNTQVMIKKFLVSEKPLRAVAWGNQDWVITAGDDLQIRIYNYQTSQKLYQFEGHTDFIRKIVYNYQQDYLLSCSDDNKIFQWKLNGKNFIKIHNFEEHRHFVMDIKINPKDSSVFASASLDTSIKVWNIGSTTSCFSLKGHKSGVNCLEYSRGDRSVLVSGGDDYTVIVWDLLNRTILQEISRHESNINDICFFDSLPFFMSTSEDGKVNFYSSKNFSFVFTVYNNMNKGWSLSTKENLMAASFDEGVVVTQIGSTKPIASSCKGKLVWIKNNEVFSANLKALPVKKFSNFEELDVKHLELGSMEIIAGRMSHNENGQYVTLQDEREYIIYKVQNFKQVKFGSGRSFVWGPSSKFAVLDERNNILIRNVNGEDEEPMDLDFYVEEIFPGTLLAVSSGKCLYFYDWETLKYITRIEVEVKNIFWFESELIISTPDTFFRVKYSRAPESESFQLISEINDKISNGMWINSMFVYISQNNKINVLIKDKYFSVATCSKEFTLLEYILNHEKIFLLDVNCKITSFKISVKLLELFKKIEDGNINLADVDCLAAEDKETLVQVLIAFNHKTMAFNISEDYSVKVELGIKINQLEKCIQLCEDAKEPLLWKKLGDSALAKGKFKIAIKAFMASGDLNSLLLIGSCLGDKSVIEVVAEKSKVSRNFNLMYQSNWILGNKLECLDALVRNSKFGQAAIFAKTYAPSQISRVVAEWREWLARNEKSVYASRIQDPTLMKEEFDQIDNLLRIEKIVEERALQHPVPSKEYVSVEEKINNLDFYKILKSEGEEGLSGHLDKIYKSSVASPMDVVNKNDEKIKEKVPQVDEEEVVEGWGELEV